jgi:hypothetical protein
LFPFFFRPERIVQIVAEAINQLYRELLDVRKRPAMTQLTSVMPGCFGWRGWIVSKRR